MNNQSILLVSPDGQQAVLPYNGEALHRGIMSGEISGPDAQVVDVYQVINGADFNWWCWALDGFDVVNRVLSGYSDAQRDLVYSLCTDGDLRDRLIDLISLTGADHPLKDSGYLDNN